MIERLHDTRGRLWHVLEAASGPLSQPMMTCFTEALSSLDSTARVILASDALVFPALSTDEHPEWLVLAGEYRRAQDNFKAHGGTLVSLVRTQLLGGPYLVHGMAATHRLVYTNTVIYPTLSPERYTRVMHTPYPHPTDSAYAHTQGLITKTITPSDWNEVLNSL